MSKKKYKKTKQRENFPWLLAALGGLFLIAAAVLLGSRESGTPVASVEQELIDFGDVTLDTPLTFSFEVKNNGNGALRFKQAPYIEVLEGC